MMHSTYMSQTGQEFSTQGEAKSPKKNLSLSKITTRVQSRGEIHRRPLTAGGHGGSRKLRGSHNLKSNTSQSNAQLNSTAYMTSGTTQTASNAIVIRNASVEGRIN